MKGTHYLSQQITPRLNISMPAMLLFSCSGNMPSFSLHPWALVLSSWAHQLSFWREVKAEIGSLLLFINLFIGCAGSLLLCWAFSTCGKWGYSLVAMCGLLIAVAPSLVVNTVSGCAGSVAVAHGLSCPMACEIFPNQGWNSCSLLWQADS